MIEEIGIHEEHADEVVCNWDDCQNGNSSKSKDIAIKSGSKAVERQNKREMSLYKRAIKQASVVASGTAELVMENGVLNGSVGLLSGFLGYTVASNVGFGFLGITLGVVSSTIVVAALGVSYVGWAAILSIADKKRERKTPLALQLPKGAPLELEGQNALTNSFDGKASDSAIQKTLQEAPLAVSGFDEELAIVSSIEKEWFSIQCDIVKLLKCPMLADMREPLVQEFHTQLSYVKSLSNRQRGNDFLLAVSTLQTKWNLLKSEAERVSLAKFDSVERKRVVLAAKLMNIALNEASTVAERQSAYRKAMEQLEGLVVLPKTVIDSIEQAVQYAEIESQM